MYTVQDAVHRRLAATPFGSRTVCKIGGTTRVMRYYLWLRHPCSAGIFAGVVQENGGTIAADNYRRIGIECEIAVRLARDLPADGAPFGADVMRGVIAAY